jgi:hypothetical protein
MDAAVEACTTRSSTIWSGSYDLPTHEFEFILLALRVEDFFGSWKDQLEALILV